MSLCCSSTYTASTFQLNLSRSMCVGVSLQRGTAESRARLRHEAIIKAKADALQVDAMMAGHDSGASPSTSQLILSHSCH
jgi:hypothetical protein